MGQVSPSKEMLSLLLQDWENASAIARAFSIGRAEAGAVSHLQSRINADTVTMLRNAVSKRGMRNFITHDLICKGVFNDGFSSGQGQTEAWAQQLTNGLDHELEPWLRDSSNLLSVFHSIMIWNSFTSFSSNYHLFFLQLSWEKPTPMFYSLDSRVERAFGFPGSITNSLDAGLHVASMLWPTDRCFLERNELPILVARCWLQVQLFVKRVCWDYDRTPSAQQKPIGFKEALNLHMSCGMFLYFREVLKQRTPQEEFGKIEKKLDESFSMGLLDCELCSAAENSVPPGDPCSVGVFRLVIYHPNTLPCIVLVSPKCRPHLLWGQPQYVWNMC